MKRFDWLLEYHRKSRLKYYLDTLKKKVENLITLLRCCDRVYPGLSQSFAEESFKYI
jgi:hypothetical protein